MPLSHIISLITKSITNICRTNLKIKKFDKNKDGTLYTCEVMCNDDDDNILISGIASVLVEE